MNEGDEAIKRLHFRSGRHLADVTVGSLNVCLREERTWLVLSSVRKSLASKIQRRVGYPECSVSSCKSLQSEGGSVDVEFVGDDGRDECDRLRVEAVEDGDHRAQRDRTPLQLTETRSIDNSAEVKSRLGILSPRKGPKNCYIAFAALVRVEQSRSLINRGATILPLAAGATHDD
jgi:hypothetical protein